MIVLYDADCGFCTQSVRWLQRHGSPAEMTPWQAADLAGLGLNEVEVSQRLHVVDGNQVYVGHEAVGVALRTCGLASMRLLGRLLRVRLLARPFGWAYDQIARHRHQLPGGTPTCEMPSTNQKLAP